MTGLSIGAEKGLWEFEGDPRSTLSGKVGIKNENGSTTWIDITGGYGSYFTAMYRTGAALARVAMGEKGVKPIKNQKGEYSDNAGMALAGFVTNRAAPQFGAAISLITDYDRKSGMVKSFGEEKSIADIATDLYTPISVQTANEDKRKDTDATLAERWRNFLLEFNGFGSSTTKIADAKIRRRNAERERSK